MKRVVLHGYGGPQQLVVEETVIPAIREDEVLLKVEAAGVNYSDALRRRNTYFMPTPLPYVLGAEAVGTIEEVGNSSAGTLKKGMRVLAILPQGGAYAEFVKAPMQYCVPLPPSISSASATAIFVQGTTAYLLIHQLAKDLKEKNVLIHAAAGGVGSLLVQLAKLAGAKTVIGTASNDKKIAVARTAGADAVINYTQKGWTDKVMQANDNKLVDVIFETIGGTIFTESFECLSRGGSMIVYGSASGEKGLIHSEHYVDKSHNLLSFNLAHFIETYTPIWQEALGAVIGLMAEGKLQVQIEKTYPLKDASLVHDLIDKRQTTGKLILQP